MKRPILFILALTTLLMPLGLRAQAVAQAETYRFDLGGGIGAAGYLGEANGSNPFTRPGLDANLSFRYLANTRLALRTVLNIAYLKGSTANIENKLPQGQVYDFSSTVTDLSVRGEFNFFNYGIGESYKALSPVTPYLALGAGFALAATSDGKGPFAAFTIPMAMGVKYKLRERLNLGAEFCMTKYFSDRMDSADLSDLTLIKSSFIKNTDWTSTVTLSLTYEFGKRCVACNRID